MYIYIYIYIYTHTQPPVVPIAQGRLYSATIECKNINRQYIRYYTLLFLSNR